MCEKYKVHTVDGYELYWRVDMKLSAGKYLLNVGLSAPSLYEAMSTPSSLPELADPFVHVVSPGCTRRVRLNVLLLCTYWLERLY